MYKLIIFINDSFIISIIEEIPLYLGIMNSFIIDVMATVKLKSAIYFKHGFCDQWGMQVDQGPYAQFHLVTGGQCQVHFNNSRIDLERGDLVIFPTGYPHRIIDRNTTNCRVGKEVVEEVMRGEHPFKGERVTTQLICGHYELDRELSHPVLDQLPEFLILKQGKYGRYNLIHNIFELISEELESKQAGSQFISLKMAEALYVAVIRNYYLNEVPDESTNLFSDRAINKVVDIIHNHLSKPLDIVMLAKEAGLSRTSFIERFKKATGNTPLQYIKNWRMTKAKYFLAETELSLSEISAEVGYQSEISFNRVFKQVYNISPGKYRRSTLQD